MAVLTSQKIALYYERFKSIDVTLSKEIIQVTGLVTNQVFLKCVGDFWPCVIFSTSFESAKVVVSIKSGILQKLERANNMVSLRFCFKNADSANPVTFFINTKSTGYAPYGGSKDVALFTLQFTQRAPDDLIEIMGRILDANVNSAKRRDERIIISTDTVRKLRLVSKETAVFIQGVPRYCILRDISFSGAKLIMMGIAKFLIDKEAALKIDFEDPREVFLIKGKFLRSEIVEGRKDLVALVILFNESIVPMGYKIRINDYVSQVRADARGTESITIDNQAERSGVDAKKAHENAPGAAGPAPQASQPPAAAKQEAAPAGKAPAPEKPAAAGTKPPGSKEDSFDLNLPLK